MCIYTFSGKLRDSKALDRIEEMKLKIKGERLEDHVEDI